MTICGPRVHWSTSCQYKYFTLKYIEDLRMQEVVDLNVCPCIISDRPVSSNDWHRPVKPSLSSLCARVYRITEQSSYVRFVQRRKHILETVVFRYLASELRWPNRGQRSPLFHCWIGLHLATFVRRLIIARPVTLYVVAFVHHQLNRGTLIIFLR